MRVLLLKSMRVIVFMQIVALLRMLERGKVQKVSITHVSERTANRYAVYYHMIMITIIVTIIIIIIIIIVYSDYGNHKLQSNTDVQLRNNVW